MDYQGVVPVLATSTAPAPVSAVVNSRVSSLARCVPCGKVVKFLKPRALRANSARGDIRPREAPRSPAGQHDRGHRFPALSAREEFLDLRHDFVGQQIEDIERGQVLFELRQPGGSGDHC